MTNATKVSRVASIALLSAMGLSMATLAACELTDESESREGSTESESADGLPIMEAEAADPLELERVLRRVERGSSTEADAAALEVFVDDDALPAEARDRASLGLSRVLEASGDEDGAVSVVEDLMKRHSASPNFEAHELAERRLRLLLSGEEEAPPSFSRHMEPTAPVAKLLAPFFPEDERGATLVDVLTVGKPPTPSDPHGIFNIAGAKRSIAEEACSVCETKVKAHRSQGRLGSWVELPLQAGERRPDMPNPDRSMVVVYFDLTENLVPSRYDEYLALPSEETVARLERGESFIAVRQRAGQKPLVLLAAPRAGQLDDVERAFAELTSLPDKPHVVRVAGKLKPHEIQGVVRAGFGGFRSCYEALLATDPTAAGRVTLKFRIDPQGVTSDVVAESSFSDATVGKCVAGKMGQMRFAASGDSTTVTYPIVFSP